MQQLRLIGTAPKPLWAKRSGRVCLMAGPIISTANGLLHLCACVQWVGLDTLTRSLRKPLWHRQPASGGRPLWRLLTYFTEQHKLIIMCLAVVTEKYRSDTLACWVAGEDSRASAKNWCCIILVTNIKASAHSPHEHLGRVREQLALCGG